MEGCFVLVFGSLESEECEMDERGGKWFGDGKDMGMNMALRHFETQRWEHG